MNREGAVKRLIFVNGTMGVGKSSVSHELKNLLAPCAFLDGDWCWDLAPFTVTEETKALVLDNAAYLLNAFLRCSAVRNVLFCWVMPARSVVDDLLSRITEPYSFQLFTLTASEKALCARLNADIAAGKRTQDVVARSLAYLPLYESEPAVIKTQLDTALQVFESCFEHRPRGFWSPDLGYFPGLENYLKAAGISYFFVSSHGLLLGPDKAAYGVFSAYKTPNGVRFFARDVDSGTVVPGYASAPVYREFFRDIGFDLPFDYVRDYMPDKKNRVFTGIKYYAVTGSEDKKIYNIEEAQKQVKEHAADFIETVQLRFKKLSKQMDKKPVIVAPFDTELFGHGWFEGVRWIEEVFRRSTEIKTFEWETPSEYLARNQEIDVVSPIFSGWGNKGFSDVWFNEKNDWVFRPVFQFSAPVQTKRTPRKGASV